MARPNILFVMFDQLRYDALGCTGGYVKTPNIDRIAAEGVSFSRCVTTSPICMPARISLACGHYPHGTGVWKNGNYTMPPDTPTWMQALRAAGYRTSLFGKTHLHPHGPHDLRKKEHLLHAYGLDDVLEIAGPHASARGASHLTARWEAKGLYKAFQEDIKERLKNRTLVRPSPLPLEEYYDVFVGEQAASYLKEYNRPEPWFCWVSFTGPHEPWDAPEPYASMYDPAAAPPPLRLVDDNPNRPRGYLDQRLATEEPLTPEHIGALRANYAGSVTLLDDQVGNLLRVVEERGEMDHTIIVFCSDHGEMNGDYGLVRKGVFLNSAVHVPLIIRTPHTATLGGRVSEALVEWIDIGPTLVELGGGTIDYEQFGQSLVPILTGAEEEHRSSVISEFRGEIMYRDERWKMVVNAQGEPYLLFDLENDPNESRNLAGRPESADIERCLSVQLLQRLVQTQRRVL